LADALLPHADAADPGLEPDIDSIWALIFTSGTSDAPKAVICSQRRLLVTGKRMSMIMDLNADDIGYVCMPLFHSNAVQVGWAPSLVVPCAVGLGRRFSASGWLPDIRRYRSTYYNNDDATAKTTRFGWYWSGDLGYKDAQGFLYFAGRNADWIRVDGENFPAGPIEETLRKAPGVVLAAVYGVPDDQAGDQVMVGL